MAKAGRRPLLIPTVEWKLRIPIDLATKADMLCLDPLRGTLTYGARSTLITELLRKHLATLAINGDNNSSINLPENSND